MAYINSDISNFYSAPSASGEFDGYPFLNQMSAIEEANSLATYDPFADPWTMLGQPEPVVDSTTSLQASAGYGKRHSNIFPDWRLTREFPEPVPSATYGTWAGGYGHPSHFGHDWSTAGEWPQYNHSGFSSQGGSFTDLVAPETPTLISTPGSSKNISSFGTFSNWVLTDYKQSRSTTGGPTKAGPLPAHPTS